MIAKRVVAVVVLICSLLCISISSALCISPPSPPPSSPSSITSSLSQYHLSHYILSPYSPLFHHAISYLSHQQYIECSIQCVQHQSSLKGAKVHTPVYHDTDDDDDSSPPAIPAYCRCQQNDDNDINWLLDHFAVGYTLYSSINCTDDDIDYIFTSVVKDSNEHIPTDQLKHLYHDIWSSIIMRVKSKTVTNLVDLTYQAIHSAIYQLYISPLLQLSEIVSSPISNHDDNNKDVDLGSVSHLILLESLMDHRRYMCMNNDQQCTYSDIIQVFNKNNTKTGEPSYQRLWDDIIFNLDSTQHDAHNHNNKQIQPHQFIHLLLQNNMKVMHKHINDNSGNADDYVEQSRLRMEFQQHQFLHDDEFLHKSVKLPRYFKSHVFTSFFKLFTYRTNYKHIKRNTSSKKGDDKESVDHKNDDDNTDDDTVFITRCTSSYTHFCIADELFIPIGYNIYWLGLDESMIYPNSMRIEDMIASTYYMHINTIRSHTTGFSSGSNVSLLLYNNTMNNLAWNSIDITYYYCYMYNIYIIAPLTDNYNYYHGRCSLT